MGASGAGKTTLLNILGLLTRPPGSRASRARSRPARRSGSSDPEEPEDRLHLPVLSPPPELSSLENALLPAMILHGRRAFRSQRRLYEEKAKEMSRFGLAARLDHDLRSRREENSSRSRSRAHCSSTLDPDRGRTHWKPRSRNRERSSNSSSMSSRSAASSSRDPRRAACSAVRSGPLHGGRPHPGRLFRADPDLSSGSSISRSSRTSRAGP